MRFSILSALLVSVALIGGAGWFKTTNVKNAPQSIVSVDSNRANELSTYTPTNKANLGTANQAISQEDTLNTTDLVSRQMFLDYINLVSEGNASTDSLDLIADKYVELIPTLSIDSPQAIKITDLAIIPDTESAYKNYDEKMTGAYNEYISALSYEDNDIFSETVEPEVENPTDHMHQEYLRIANSLKVIPVPSSIATLQLELINHYLELAFLFENISSESDDPATLMAHMVKINNKIYADDAIIEQINKTLKKYAL